MIPLSKTGFGRIPSKFKKKALGLQVRLVPLVCALAVPFSVQAEEATREQLLKRIAQLEQQMARMDRLEQRLNELETTAVLSDPETYVSQVEIFVDDDGVEHATKQPGTHSVVTYQRERVYRRQTINEKIEDALSGDAASRVQVGVDAAITMQYATQDKGRTVKPMVSSTSWHRPIFTLPPRLRKTPFSTLTSSVSAAPRRAVKSVASPILTVTPRACARTTISSTISVFAKPG